MKTLAILASVSFGVLSSAPAPDIAPNPVSRKGEALAPRAPTAVAMTAETVTITLDTDCAIVHASFTMKNTGASEETLEVGFPTAAQPSSYSMSTSKGITVKAWGPATIDDFVAKVDGAEVKAEPKDAERVEKEGLRGWLCWPMTYQAGQTRSVDVSYSVKTNDPNYTEPSPLRLRQLSYILKTGAGWHGTIGSAKIVLKTGTLSPKHLVKTSPEPARKTADSVEWEMKDFEPDADILISYHVFADAADAIAKLAPRALADAPSTDDLLDYAEALEMDGRNAAAADAFMKLHRLELERKTFARHARGPWESPAARAAKLYKKAGDAAKTSEAAKAAVSRIETVINDLEDRQKMVMLRKAVGATLEDLRKTMDECRALAASSG